MKKVNDVFGLTYIFDIFFGNAWLLSLISTNVLKVGKSTDALNFYKNTNFQ